METNYSLLAQETFLLLAGLVLVAAPLAILASLRPGFMPCVIYALLITVSIQIGFEKYNFTKVGFVPIYAVALAALWPLRRHLATLLIAVFAVFNLTTIGLSLTAQETMSAAVREPGQRADLPPIVHVILDEQVGLDGLEDGTPGASDLRSWLLTLLAGEGFRVFGRTHSLYHATTYSIPHALNFGDSTSPTEFVTGEKLHFALAANAYFKRAHEKGYSIRVYQSDFLDYCAVPGVTVSFCHTFGINRPSGPVWGNLDVFRRSLVLLHMYSGPTIAFELARKTLIALSKSLQSGVSQAQPWPRGLHRSVAPISSLHAFERLIADLAATRRGTLYFAHFLMPHHPYVFDRNCGLRDPILGWGHLFATTPEDRNDRYAQYHDQVRCTFRKFREMLDQLKAAGMFDDAVILVHGDHGSRIGRWASLGVDSKEAQTPQSRLDTYSTLFAVRAPWIEGGYDPGHSSLPDLVREFALGGLAGPGAASACREAAGGC